MYIPIYLQSTLHFRPKLNFLGFLILDSAVGKEPWPDFLSAIPNTLYHCPVLGDERLLMHQCDIETVIHCTEK
jgi:hypothetical protein